MKQLLIIFSLGYIILLTNGQTALADQTKTLTTNLEIHITGFENSDGLAKVAINNSKENYESDGKPFKGFEYKISNNEVVQTVILPYGRYAVKVFHDENNNDQLDTRIFGIPKERYGFSNNARGSFGPPDYEKTEFILTNAEQTITIQVK
jgi:uncharacterized protein (DUF2141 family)